MKKVSLYIFCLLLFVTGGTHAGRVITLMSSPGPTNYTQDANCVGAWYLDGSTTEYDRSGEGNDLSVDGTAMPTSTTVPTGYSGTSREFTLADTSLLYITDANAGALDISGVDAQMSICAWFRLKTTVPTNDFYYIAAKHGNSGYRQYGIYAYDENDVDMAKFWVSPDGGNVYLVHTTTALSVDTWYHVCGVYDDANLEIWLNGTLEDTLAYTGGIADETNPFHIGGRFDNDTLGNTDAHMDGYIDEVIVFNRALSSSEINEIITSGISGNKGGSDSSQPPPDTTPPTVVAGSGTNIASDGTTVNVEFSETVVTTGYDDGDLELTCSTAGTVALNTITGTGSTRSFTAASTVNKGDTCTIGTSATYGADEIEDEAGNDLVGFSGTAVVNNSTQGSQGGTDYTQHANCVAAYLMNGSTTELDRSGNGYDLTPGSGVTVPTSVTVPSGYSGTSRNFAELDEDHLYIDETSAPGLDINGVDAQITLAGWFYLDGAIGSGDFDYVVAKHGTSGYRQYGIYVYDDSGTTHVAFFLSSNGANVADVVSTTTIMPNTWYHVAGTSDDVNIKLYINGVEESSESYIDGIADENVPFAIGARFHTDASAATYSHFNGLIDEIIVFNTAMGSTEINEMMTYGIDGSNGAND